MPGTGRVVRRETARAASCTHDALCGGEKAYGCCATKQSSTPIILAESHFFGQRDSILTASSAQFESQSSLLQEEDDTPMNHVLVRLGVNGPGIDGKRLLYNRTRKKIEGSCLQTAHDGRAR